MTKHGQTGGNNNPFSLYNPQDIILFLTFAKIDNSQNQYKW